MKILFDENGVPHEVAHINGYLMGAPDVFVESRSKPLCNVPILMSGNRATDGGYLILEPSDRDALIKQAPSVERFIKRFMMGYEFINSVPRYCLWLVDATPAELRGMSCIRTRLEKCREERLKSPDESRRKLADTPHLFREQINPDFFVAIPKVSSERRLYIPMGYLNSEVIAGDKLFIIPNATLFHFGILNSSVHMAWTRVVCGRLKSDYSYSINIVYNNFPWPECLRQLTQSSQSGAKSLSSSADSAFSVSAPAGENPVNPVNPVEKITATAQGILDARALYPDASLADLYDPLTMPPELRKAHAANDAAVLAAYGFGPRATESEIVARLFGMYEKLTKKEKN